MHNDETGIGAPSRSPAGLMAPQSGSGSTATVVARTDARAESLISQLAQVASRLIRPVHSDFPRSVLIHCGRPFFRSWSR